MANTLRFKRGLVSTIPTALAGEPLFTTDTFDLYIGNGTTNTRFQKYIASGTTSQLLRGDGSLLTMPIVLTSPANGQVLKYNGTNWVNDSDAGITGSGTTNYLPKFTGASTLGNSTIFDNGTSVGIGTITPLAASKLQVNGQFRQVYSKAFSSNPLDTDGYAGHIIVNSNNANGDMAGIGMYTNNSYTAAAGVFALQESISSASLVFYSGSNTGTQRARITGGGNFIINNPSVDNGLRFQVTGDGFFSGSVGIGTTPSAKLHIGESGAAAQLWLQRTDGYNPVKLIGGTLADGNGFKITMNTTDVLNLTSSGNLGLGVVPSAWSGGIFKGFEIGRIGSSIYNTPSANQIGFTTNAYNDGTWKYANAGLATALSIVDGAYYWYNAPSGSANAAITFTTAMTLDASGNLAIGQTTSALQSGGTGVTLYGATSSEIKFLNSTTGSAATDGTALVCNGNNFTINNREAGSIILGTSNANQVYLFSTGNLGIGVTSDATYKLDVNGTMRVSGASTFGGLMTLTLNQNGQTISTVRNTTAGTSSEAYFQATSDASSGSSTFGKTSSLFSGYKILTASSGYIYNGTAGNLAILNDVASGSIVMAAGGSSTAHFTIASTGAATFSSSISAGASSIIGTPLTLTAQYANGITFINTNAGVDNRNFRIISDQSVYADFQIQKSTTQGGSTYTNLLTFAQSGAATFSSSVTAGGVISNRTSDALSGQFLRSTIDGTGVTNNGIIIGKAASTNNVATIVYTHTSDGSSSNRLGLGFWGADNLLNLNASGNVGISTTTPSYKLDVTGEARVSNAIAIGTTPDTNKPFKILKNINGTVGINFENTSTGASAFSAIQMGTDVTGGTKFTNLVYSSSGVTASGVYQPDGTSLINNGSGGLNLLGTPTRFYTGGSNGVVRLYLDNNGLTQLNATTPTTSETDGYRQYSADVVAGNAAPHFRTENGAVIKLYQETTAVGNSTISVGGGNAVLDDTEFGGYTLRQVVQALKNQGILA